MPDNAWRVFIMRKNTRLTAANNRGRLLAEVMLLIKWRD